MKALGLLLVVWALVIVLMSAGCEDRRADKAYLRRDYDTAFTKLHELAIAGEPRAQYDLGVLYDKGQGVPQSDQEAKRWYSLAADQGEPRAEYNLGLMYMNGQGVRADPVIAYYLISLSAAQGDKHALEARDYVSEKLTSEQLMAAKQLVREHQEKAARQRACVLCQLFRGTVPP
jgi:TPR repeat protein